MQRPPPTRRASPEPDAIAPDGSEIRLLAAHAQGALYASLCEVRLPAGAVSRPVAHRSVEEIWYILEGCGRVWRRPRGGRGDAMEVGPGDSIVIPATWAFQFSAAPDGPLRFLCYTSPPWPGPDEALPVAAGGLGEPTV